MCLCISLALITKNNCALRFSFLFFFVWRKMVSSTICWFWSSILISTAMIYLHVIEYQNFVFRVWASLFLSWLSHFSFISSVCLLCNVCLRSYVRNLHRCIAWKCNVRILVICWCLALCMDVKWWESSRLFFLICECSGFVFCRLLQNTRLRVLEKVSIILRCGGVTSTQPPRTSVGRQESMSVLMTEMHFQVFLAVQFFQSCDFAHLFVNTSVITSKVLGCMCFWLLLCYQCLRIK